MNIIDVLQFLGILLLFAIVMWWRSSWHMKTMGRYVVFRDKDGKTKVRQESEEAK